MEPNKLAIIISGAVSLGSYESGVMFDIIDAIGQHNRHPDTADEDRILIDVITGASAGGMTGTILAQKLLYESGRLTDPYDNDLYNPWVETVDIEGLLDDTLGDDPSLSFLSSNFVANIADKYLLERYSNPAKTIEPHAAAADEIHLGLSMSNMNGLDCTIKMTGVTSNDEENDEYREDLEFVYTRFKDRMVDEIEAGTKFDNKGFWEKLGLGARACGAFPFAFRMLDIPRHHSEREYRGVDPFPPGEFTYTDGGTFHNEPVGMAKMLVDRIDPKHINYDKRYYLYIAPSAKKSSANTELEENNAHFINAGKALVGAVFNQARYHDWIRAMRKNDKVELFDKRAEALIAVVTESNETKKHFKDVSERLLEKLYAGHDDELVRDLERLRDQFTDDYNQITDIDAADTWIKSVLVLEKAADLGAVDKLNIYSITASPKELAGEGFFAFGGFLSKQWRRYDYYRGRQKAAFFLEQLKASNKGMPLKNFTLQPINVPEEDLGKATLEQIDESIRKRFRKRVIVRSKKIIDGYRNLNWFARFFAKIGVGLVLGSILNKMLKLTADVDEPEDDLESP